MLKDTIGDSTPGTKSNYQEELSSLQDHHQSSTLVVLLLPLYNTKWPSTGKKSFFCRSEAALHLTIGQMILIRSFNFYFSVTRRRSLILILTAVFIPFFSEKDVVSIWYTKKLAVSIQHWKWKGRRRGPKVTEHFLCRAESLLLQLSSLVAKEADNWTLIGWISLTLKNNSQRRRRFD